MSDLYTTRSYANGHHFRLYKGIATKTTSDGTPMRGSFWELGLGRYNITISRWDRRAGGREPT